MEPKQLKPDTVSELGHALGLGIGMTYEDFNLNIDGEDAPEFYQLMTHWYDPDNANSIGMTITPLQRDCLSTVQ